MKKIAILAPAALLVLSACGESTDASEEAMADTVEISADEAMEGTPDPVADGDLASEEAIDDAVDAATSEAEEAADAAQATVDDVMDAAAAAEAASDEMAGTVE